LATSSEQHKALLDDLLRDAARSLLAAHAALPTEAGIADKVADANAAEKRGYFKPGEDERLRESYVQYLGIRSAIWQTVQELMPYIELPRRFKKGDWQNHLRAFAIAFCGAAMLVRSGYYLIDMANTYPVVRKKLDEAEPRYGIERKQFTAIYDSLLSAQRIAQYYSALQFFNKNRDEIFEALDGPLYSKVSKVLTAEEPYFETSLTDQIKRKANFGVFSLRRRQSTALQKTLHFVSEAFGNDLSEMTQPFVKPKGAGKRIDNKVREKLVELARPGDVFVTRHDDAMTNLFLPGFWPHAALYIGTNMDREKIGVEPSRPAHQSLPGKIHFLEAKKDGVLFRPYEETLQVDSCVILRPKLERPELAAALNRALSHSGKLYDFIFDFSQAERLVCSELIYRTYDGYAGMEFKLGEKAGRKCLSTEDFLNQSLSQNWFDVIALYGVGNELFFEGEDAKSRLIASYAAEISSTR
jgi:hypothetical protein